MNLDPLVILSRWVHVISACGVIGAGFFFAFLLPGALKDIDSAARDTVLARTRRGFKMTVHISLLLFLASGIFNAMRNWPVYNSNPGATHPWFGMHLTFGIVGLTILMVILAGKSANPMKSPSGDWRAKVAVIMLLLAVAAASTLKSTREWTLAHKAPSPSAATAR